MDPSNPAPNDYTGSRNPLLTKQAIIVLREELEYFVIPPPGDDGLPVHDFTNDQGIADDDHLALKRQCGGHLLDKKSIFTALQRNVNKENNVAEQHLIDMLCMSGFDRDDAWGFRAIEPSRCCISSIALVLLKTGISHLDNAEVIVDQHQMSTAQKLLLFWRKPAVRVIYRLVLPRLRTELLIHVFGNGTAQMLVGRRRSQYTCRRGTEEDQVMGQKSLDAGAQLGQSSLSKDSSTSSDSFAL